jgi:hypothetical protein
MHFQVFKVVLDLYFVYNPEIMHDENIDEPELSEEEIDEFMKSPDNYRSRPRYHYYAKYIIDSLTAFSYALNTESTISYEDGGRLTFTFKYADNELLDPEDVERNILYDSFEDGMMEGELGNEILVPSRKKYKISSGDESEDGDEDAKEYVELGHIECRNSDCIHVELVEQGEFSA